MQTNCNETWLNDIAHACRSAFETHFDVAKHLLEVMAAASERKMVEDVLIHQLDVRISQLDGAIVVSEEHKREEL